MLVPNSFFLQRLCRSCNCKKLCLKCEKNRSGRTCSLFHLVISIFTFSPIHIKQVICQPCQLPESPTLPDRLFCQFRASKSALWQKLCCSETPTHGFQSSKIPKSSVGLAAQPRWIEIGKKVSSKQKCIYIFRGICWSSNGVAVDLRSINSSDNRRIIWVRFAMLIALSFIRGATKYW